MTDITRQQRWISWRNMDATTCPPFGVVQIGGFESVGANLLLQGVSSTNFITEPNFDINISGYGEVVATRVNRGQGASWKNAFNNELAVAPGEIGQCTFDLPAWAATLGDNPFPFATVLTFGNFYSYERLVVPPGFSGSLPLIGNPGCVIVGEPWRLGAFPPSVAPFLILDESGYNVYHNDTVYTHSTNRGRTLVGGARTFIRNANTANGS